MGKLIVTEFVTLDGVAQAPGGPDEDRDSGFTHGGWQAPLLGPGVRRRHVRASEEHGRAAPRPEDLRDLRQLLADALQRRSRSPACSTRVPKYVASRTLAGPLAWQGSTLVAGDLAEGITALKERHDEVHVIGSLDLVQSLLRFGLVDRLNLWLYPLLLGSGKQVFADGTVPTALRLTESVTYPSGTLHLAYETAGAPTYGNLA